MYYDIILYHEILFNIMWYAFMIFFSDMYYVIM